MSTNDVVVDNLALITKTLELQIDMTERLSKRISSLEKIMLVLLQNTTLTPEQVRSIEETFKA